MLVNIILIIICMIGSIILLYLLSCLHKQYKSSSNLEIIEIFPKSDMYVENAYEEDRFILSFEEKKKNEKWSATQRGSVRISCASYFTTQEYLNYRNEVLKNKLP